jgi:hypothetical protein
MAKVDEDDVNKGNDEANAEEMADQLDKAKKAPQGQAENKEQPTVVIDPSDDIPNNTDKSIDFDA